MNQTQRQQLMENSILHAILETLTHNSNRNFEKNDWVTRLSLLFPGWKTLVLIKVFQRLNWRQRHSWCLRQRKLFRTQHWEARGNSGNLIDLVGMASIEAPQATLLLILASLKRLSHFWLELLDMAHPVASTWAKRLAIYGNSLA